MLRRLTIIALILIAISPSLHIDGAHSHMVAHHGYGADVFAEMDSGGKGETDQSTAADHTCAMCCCFGHVLTPAAIAVPRIAVGQQHPLPAPLFSRQASIDTPKRPPRTV